MGVEGGVAVVAGTLTRRPLTVPHTALVCAGFGDHSGLSADIETLAASGRFDGEVLFVAAANEPDRYWCHLLAELPEEVDVALVIPAGALITADLLRLGALVSDKTAVAQPLGLQHEFARPFMTSDETLKLSVSDINQWLNRYALGRPVELPLLSGPCGWINASMLRNLQADNDDQLASAIRSNGASIVLSDEAFVDDTACQTGGAGVAALPEALEVALCERHPYTAVRHPLSQLNEQGDTPPALLGRGPGAVLHISHSWGGGLERWVNDFVSAEEEHIHLTLKSVGIRDAAAQALALHIDGSPMPIKQWALTTPIQSTSLGSYEYRQILDEIQRSFSVEGLVISTLIGHSLDLYDLPVPKIQVLHDYYPWCPPLYATWENPCAACDGERLHRCLKSNPNHRFFGEERTDWYLALREQFIQRVKDQAVPLIAPSASVKRRWLQLAPKLDEASIEVIAHGLPEWELTAFNQHRWTPASERKLHLLVLGVLSSHKGGGLLRDALPELLNRYRITLLGAGSEAATFSPHPDLNVASEYQLPDLPGMLQSLRPDVGLLLSTVPETFSYTLSELYAAGVPPVATRLGAFEDRIEEGVTGWLIEPSAQSLLAALTKIDQDRSQLGTMRDRLLQAESRCTADMVRDYLSLLPMAGTAVQRRPLVRSVVVDAGVDLSQADASQKALFVRPNATYRLALFQFLLYSHKKCCESPKLTFLSRKLLSWTLRAALKLVRPKS